MGTVVPATTAAPILQRVLDALAEEPVHVHVALCDSTLASWPGAVIDPAELRAPANATVTGYVRHAAVLPRTRLFVSHAGLSSIGAALTFGVPMLLMPVFNEQPDNARHATDLGVARTVAIDATTDELRTAARALLDDDATRSTARQVASQLRQRGNGAAAVDALERLAVRGAP
jgi:MGT family glycosyltransferase